MLPPGPRGRFQPFSKGGGGAPGRCVPMTRPLGKRLEGPTNEEVFPVNKKLYRKIEPYIWISPSVILMAVFILTPILSVFRMAANKVSRTGKLQGFNNFANFTSVVNNPAFSLVLKNTVIWTIAVVVISTVLGFMLALVLNNNFKGRKIVRAIVVFPWATTLVIQASVWNFIINTDYGTLNTLLLKLGIIQEAVNWTPTPAAYFAWEIACGIFVTIQLCRKNIS